MSASQMSGLSVFRLDKEHKKIYRTYSAFGRGHEQFNAVQLVSSRYPLLTGGSRVLQLYPLFDALPEGRNGYMPVHKHLIKA